MMYAGRAVFAVALVAASVAALPNHLKAVVVDTDPVPVHVVKEIVPVVRERETPAYSAQAGVGGAGVYAAADSPLGSASAGLGDSGPTHTVGSQPGGSVGHKPVHNGPGFFDSIFNIPISVLQSVNTYLNNRGPITKQAYRRRGHHPVVQEKVGTPQEHTPQTAGVPDASSSASSSASASASAGAAADSGADGAGAHPPQNHGPVVVQKRVNYDEIFNIPIAALKSVNQLLNG